jgi:hypothetical protein
MAKLEQGLIYRRLADAQVFLSRDPEVDTQKHRRWRALVLEQVGSDEIRRDT